MPEQIEGQYASFEFKDLCEKVSEDRSQHVAKLFSPPSFRQALGPADFLSITSSYPTVIIRNIPQLKLTAKNEARRFITFLDAACERTL